MGVFLIALKVAWQNIPPAPTNEPASDNYPLRKWGIPVLEGELKVFSDLKEFKYVTLQGF